MLSCFILAQVNGLFCWTEHKHSEHQHSFLLRKNIHQGRRKYCTLDGDQERAGTSVCCLLEQQMQKKVIYYTSLFNSQHELQYMHSVGLDGGNYCGKILLFPNVFSANTLCVHSFTICKWLHMDAIIIPARLFHSAWYLQVNCIS